MPALLPDSEIAGLLADLSSPIDAEVALSESFSDDDDGLEDLLSPYLTSPDEGSTGTAGAWPGPRPSAEGASLSAGAGPSDGASIELVHEELRALRADNSTLKRKLKLLQANEQAELRTYRVSVEAAQSRTRDKVRSLREALVRIQAEVPALREKLAHTKSSFAALRISSEHYRKIISTPEEQTSVVEYVQARVHEVLTQTEAPIEELRSAHTAAAVAQTGIVAQLSSEGAHRAAAESQVRQLKAEMVRLRDELDATRLKLSEELLAAAHKAGRAEPTETQSLLEAHDKVAVAEARLEEVRSDAKRAAEAADHLARDSAAREQMLGLDKAYLSTQLESERQKLVMAEAELTRCQGRMAELKAEKDAMYDKLMAATADQMAGYTGRLDSEMAKWEKQAVLSAARTEAQHQSALSQLREARDLALAETDKWHVRHDELQRAHEEQVTQSTVRQAESASLLAETKSELKLKAFEAERLSMQLETALAASRRDALAADAAREKLEMLKTEYYSLQARPVPAAHGHPHAGEHTVVCAPHPCRASSRTCRRSRATPQVSTSTKATELGADLQSARERLSVYEGLERELDETILRAGASALSSPDSVLSPPAVRVPASAQARIKQSIMLSTELIAARRVADELRATLSDRQVDVERMRQQLADANRRYRLAPTPQGYLIEQLEAAELQAKQQAARAEAAARDASDRQAALEASQQQLRMLRADLERLLQQRGSIDALRNTLSGLL